MKKHWHLAFFSKFLKNQDKNEKIIEDLSPFYHLECASYVLSAMLCVKSLGNPKKEILPFLFLQTQKLETFRS